MLTWLCALVAAALVASVTFSPLDALPEVLSLKLYHIHTGETATIVFKRNGVYDQAGLAKLNMFLRDWRKEQPTNMDPHLFDLLYQVYQQSGSTDYIHIVCGYRSPETNALLRSRSRGVAQHSLHMQGKAIDFFIPDVPLAKLRAIGLKLQIGGVGFYPTSGSPFVHMDTGTVRHWPRMTRQELLALFPNGRTLDIPTDGVPLPGYAEALAAYNARKNSGVAIATFNDNPKSAPIQVAADDNGDEGTDDLADAATFARKRTQAMTVAAVAPAAVVAPAAAPAPAPARTLAVAVADYATMPVPMPRLAPTRAAAVDASAVVALFAPRPAPAAAPAATQAPVAMTVVATLEPRATSLAPDFDFGSSQDWSAPAVPSALAKAMAERDQSRRGASLPIPPTSVVATIDVNRPLRAEAITTAVLRYSTQAVPALPTVLAYAASDPPPAVRPRKAIMTSAGVPLPLLSPVHDPIPTAGTAAAAPSRAPSFNAPDLTMTALDTAGLRMWIGSASTRQKPYALLTMPDYMQVPGLLDKPSVVFGAGFGALAYPDLRTDAFAGPLVEQPTMVDLTAEPLIASIR